MKKLLFALVLSAAAGVFGATTAEYVSTGLVSFWDGYENDGAGGHSTTLTEWTDTSGTYPFVFNTSAAIETRPLGLYFPGGTKNDYATLSAVNSAETFNLCSNGVMEVVVRSEKNANVIFLVSMSASGIALTQAFANSNVILRPGIWSTPSYYFDWTSGINTISLGYSLAVNASLHVNNSVPTKSSSGAVTAQKLTYLGGTALANIFKGTVYAIRLYSAPLTDAQREANAVLDDMRFRKGDIYPLTGLYVRGEPQDYGAGVAPAYGFEAMASGTAVERTAPAYVELSANERAYCTGWKLYDRATGELLSESKDATRLVCAFTYSKPVRLDWQWDVRYPVTVSADTGLTVSPASAWGSAAAPAAFTVTGTDFPLWSGETLSGDAHAKSVAFAPTNATAVTVAASVVRTATTVAALKTAIAASADGDVVVIGNDLSFADVTAAEMADGLALTNAVLVTSQSGDPKDIAIDLGGTGHGFTLNAAGARLKGLTFTSSVAMNDSADLTLPRFVNVLAGTLDACVFKDIVLGGTKATGSHPVSLAPGGVVENCRFTNLSCTPQNLTKGALYTTGGTVRKTEFRSCNTCPAPLLANCLTANTTEIEDCLFTDIVSSDATRGANYASIYSHGDSDATGRRFNARRTVVANNTSPGGATYVRSGGASSASAMFEDCVFTNNVATLTTGAGVLNLSNRPSVTFDRCLIADNVGGKYGVLAGTSYATQMFRNCLIRGNTGKTVAGVVYATGSNVRFQFENCTVTENKTLSGTVAGIGIAGCGTAATTWVKNCIVCGNTGADTQLSVDADRVFNSCYPEATDGTNGNISSDPKLQSDGTLDYSSPCLDAGLNLSLTAGTLDVTGRTRPQNGTGGQILLWDIGAVEMPPNTTPLLVSVAIDATLGAVPATVTATASATGTRLSGLTYDWTVTRTTPSGSTVTNYTGLTSPDLVLTNLDVGVYTVAVKVRNDAKDTASATCGDTFAAKPAVCYVSKDGSATWPYDTPAKAAKILADALTNTAVRVEIAAGEYDASEMGTMTDAMAGTFLGIVEGAVEVRGAGVGETVIDFNNAGAGFLLKNTDARVDGLTLLNAASTAALFSGVAFCVNAGVVSNVVVNGGAIWGTSVYLGPDALFTDSVITNVTRYSNKSGTHPVDLCCGAITDTLIVGNTGYDCGGIVVLSPTVSRRAQIRRVRVLNNTVLNGMSALSGGYPVDVTDCEFSGNDSTAGNGGSTVYVPTGAPTSPSMAMTNCRITNNRIAKTGGAMAINGYFWGTNVLVSGNIGVGSDSKYGLRGVAVAGSSSFEFVNCTVTDNESPTSVNGGISVGSYDKAGKTIKNCVFWGNRGIGGEGSTNAVFDATARVPVITSCCWPEAPATDGCTAADPQLRTHGRRKYYPRLTGSCFNAGANEAWMETAKDLDGNDRILYDRVDIGCFEIPHDPGLMLLVK